MAYQIKMIYSDGETILEDELYDTYEEAEYMANENVSDYRTGAEVLDLAGRDFDDEDCSYEILEV